MPDRAYCGKYAIRSVRCQEGLGQIRIMTGITACRVRYWLLYGAALVTASASAQTTNVEALDIPYGPVSYQLLDVYSGDVTGHGPVILLTAIRSFA